MVSVTSIQQLWFDFGENSQAKLRPAKYYFRSVLFQGFFIWRLSSCAFHDRNSIYNFIFRYTGILVLRITKKTYVIWFSLKYLLLKWVLSRCEYIIFTPIVCLEYLSKYSLHKITIIIILADLNSRTRHFSLYTFYVKKVLKYIFCSVFDISIVLYFRSFLIFGTYFRDKNTIIFSW